MSATFFTPSSAFRSRHTVQLPADEARHALRVLRKREGDEICLVDGEGGWYRARLESGGRARILEAKREVGEPTYRLSIGVGLLKNRSRFEIFLEKAVELGVSTIIPMHTQRSEAFAFRHARARQILIAAMKQCGRSRIPHLHQPLPFTDIFTADDAHVRMIAHEKAGLRNSLPAEIETAGPTSRIRILTGPEGGFTDEELRQATLCGYKPVSLGPRRLRSETAALAAAATVMMVLAKHPHDGIVREAAAEDP